MANLRPFPSSGWQPSLEKTVNERFILFFVVRGSDLQFAALFFVSFTAFEMTKYTINSLLLHLFNIFAYISDRNKDCSN